MTASFMKMDDVYQNSRSITKVANPLRNKQNFQHMARVKISRTDALLSQTLAVDSPCSSHGFDSPSVSNPFEGFSKQENHHHQLTRLNISASDFEECKNYQGLFVVYFITTIF